MASITSIGVGSGLDLENLVSQLVDAERVPTENRLDLRKAEVQASISAFGSLKGVLSGFQTALADLKDLADFEGRTTSASDTSLFSATATNQAAVGNYSINVLDLAQNHKVVSRGFSSPSDIIGTGTLTLEVNSNAFSVDISTGSLTEVRDAINDATDNTGVTASILTVDDGVGGTESKLVFTASESGEDHEIKITVADDDLVNDDNSGLSELFFEQGSVNNQLSEIDVAQDARITVDGFTVSSSSNTFGNAIEGVTITALAESEDPVNNPPDSLSVNLGKAGVNSKVIVFVEAYNSLKGVFDKLTGFDAATGTAGLLNGDSTVRTLENQLRRILSDRVSGLSGTLDTLTGLGITTNDSGQLTLDQSTLDTAIENDFDAVGELFSSTDGIAARLDNLVSDYLSTSGQFKMREDGLDAELGDIEEQREALDFRVTNLEARVRQQFSGLDILISQLNSTGSFLMEQLKNTSAIITGIKD